MRPRTYSRGLRNRKTYANANANGAQRYEQFLQVGWQCWDLNSKSQQYSRLLASSLPFPTRTGLSTALWVN